MLLLLDAAREGSPEGALQLLMRWSGVFICDGDTLRRGDAHASGEQVLRSAKSGELVTVQLPHLVLEALAALPERDGPSYFLVRQVPPPDPPAVPAEPAELACAGAPGHLRPRLAAGPRLRSRPRPPRLPAVPSGGPGAT